MSFKTPILFIIFNRPELTKQVFEAIRAIKPEKLFIAADGPRANKPDDQKKCQETRDIVIKNIDWECEVKTLFQEENLGCGIAPSQAITWFFGNVEAGIILEDDCIPSPSFFHFCDELLEYYKNDTRIMHISGSNFQDGVKRGEGSYYFSKYAQCFGAWATWRRAWKYYDYSLSNLDLYLQHNNFDSSLEKKLWSKHFNYTKDNQIDVWDHQWNFCVFSQSGLSIVPNANLVSNIGFGDNATHTIYPFSKFANMKMGALDKLKHPKLILRNRLADNYTFKNNFRTNWINFFFKGCVFVMYKVVSFFKKKFFN